MEVLKNDTDKQSNYHMLADDLTEDVKLCWELIEKQDSQFHRRNFVRAAFSALESITNLLKFDSLERIESNPELYTEAELALLREESYYLNNGKVTTSRNNFPNPADNFYFALDMVMKKSLYGFRLDRSHNEWNQFTKSWNIRNRITHPKNHKHITISDDDLALVKRAFDWGSETAFLHVKENLDLQKKELNELKQKVLEMEKLKEDLELKSQ